MTKKIPLRRCLATGERLAKKDLLRIVHTPEGLFQVDLTGKINGRGAYLKKTAEALEIAKKKHVFKAAFGVVVPDSLYVEIASYLHE